MERKSMDDTEEERRAGSNANKCTHSRVHKPDGASVNKQRV